MVDEPDEIALIDDPSIENVEKARRDSIWQNIKDFGRTKNYRHTLLASYNLPIRLLPFMDWIQARAQYQAEYGWNAAALNTDSLGNIIQNTQNIQFTADLNFEGLYNKIGFLQRSTGAERPRQEGACRGRGPKTRKRKKQKER